MDKAGKIYWDSLWKEESAPRAFDPKTTSLNNYINRRFHEYFYQLFKGSNTRGKRLLEVGCARSVWLPYFAREFGFHVSGIDYSEIGCRQAKTVLQKEGVKGKIICANFFAPPKEVIELFDVVVSFGVAEHFEDTAACIQAFSRFLKPGGMLITIIPNLVGFIGMLQRLLNKKVYDIHTLMNLNNLRDAHDSLGLKVIACSYFIFANFGVLNLAGVEKDSFLFWVKKLALFFLHEITKIIWVFELIFFQIPANRFLSPYIVCVGQKSL
jgi:2-polyprenyl-3-methyl-5-hydroxy-6-metoxy-1,4-benzoquinol methylase